MVFEVVGVTCIVSVLEVCCLTAFLLLFLLLRYK